MARRRQRNTDPRNTSRSAKFTAAEAARIDAAAARARMSVSDFLRSAALETPPPRAKPQPTPNITEICRLIGTFGDLAQSLRDAASSGDQSAVSAQIDAAHRDIADLALACRQALGQRP